MVTSAEIVALEDRYGAHNYHPIPVVLTRGRGCWVWDVEGNKYLDCLAAYSAVNQGHSHPRIVEALVSQVRRLALTSRAFVNDQLGPFCRDVSELTGFERVLPMNTGSEAVETAIKAVRKWAYKVKGVPEHEAEIIVCEDNFHGRTTTVISFSTDPQNKDGFGPYTPGFKVVPYGDPDAIEAAITPNTAAVLMEPIQGEAGIIIPPEGTLSRVRETCTRNNVLFVLDEIQSGLGRTGKMFAWEHDDARPDAMVLGKALSGGLVPLSVFVADSEVMDVFTPGDHGSTYGGNPVAAAAGREALKVLVEDDLVNNAVVMGARFQEGLASLDSPSIKEIRQIGLWIGIELHPDAGGARIVCERLKELGMLCKETHEHTVRIAPPLCIEADEVDWALEQLARVFP